MGSPKSLSSPDTCLVADTSVIINLNASGFARNIIQALPGKVVITDAVKTELEEGRSYGWKDADMLEMYFADGLIEVVDLNETAAQKFEGLVTGPAVMTLDDGEAATIAYSDVNKTIALIDERKANRICAERFPELTVKCTVDLFAHSCVETRLGQDNLKLAVFNALYHGQMRVFPHHIEWVVNLIGINRANMCNSLPRAARTLDAS